MHLRLTALALLAATLPIGAQSAPRATTTTPPARLEELKQLRDEVWVAWFAGDVDRLRTVLGPELVAISPDGEAWQSLEESLAGSAAFKASGRRLVALTFRQTRTHQFGDVVVMFSHYHLETADREGARSIQHGRATEVFVRVGKRWVHTSWHLDAVE